MGIPRTLMVLTPAHIQKAIIKSQPFQAILTSRHYNNELFWEVLKRGYTSPSGIPGSGAGKGGGGGGSVRQSGGGLGQYGAAQEEGYFHHKQREQLEKIKKQLKEGNPEISQKKNK